MIGSLDQADGAMLVIFIILGTPYPSTPVFFIPAIWWCNLPVPGSQLNDPLTLKYTHIPQRHYVFYEYLANRWQVLNMPVQAQAGATSGSVLAIYW